MVMLLCTVGCSQSIQPTVQPVLEIPTYNGVTQYDYKAGAPDIHTPQPAPETYAVNPYLNKAPEKNLGDYFPEKPSTHYTPWMNGWGGYFYSNPIPVYTVFWSGSATITVQ